MLKIFLYKRKQGIQDSYLLNLFLTEEREAGLLFQKVPTAPFKELVQFVSNPTEAQYLLLPHAYFSIKSEIDYLDELKHFAQQNDLKTIIFAYGDLHEDIIFDNSIILRTAKYKSKLHDNEIILAPFIEDLGDKYGVDYRMKSEIANIGFAGMTHLPNLKSEIKYQIRLFLSRVKEILGWRFVFERQGLYFRRKVITILSGSNFVNLQTLKRKSYSASKSTIQGNPQLMRQEFIDIIKNSDLPLVIRGDGNFSLRFFEVLSLGRVPLFIDTDTPLPFEDEIDYDSFMVRVNYKDINCLPEIVSEFWNKTSDEQFLEMQEKARLNFENTLRPDVFYKKLFSSFEENAVKT